jgi:site-specific recombinase XerD
MKKEALLEFEKYLQGVVKKNGKPLSEKTIHNSLTLARYIADTPLNSSLEYLKVLHKNYLQERNYPTASYSLGLYLKSLGYEEKLIQEILSFRKKNISAIMDEEKLSNSILSKNELFFLVDNIKNKRDNLIVRFLYDTAARVSEMTNLKLKDFDMSTREVQLMGKGRKPRSVFFQPKTLELLKDHITDNFIVNPNDLVFNVKPMTVWYNLKKYGKEFLSRDLHPHMFRHSRLQHMADEGVDSFAIKSYAGHSDISTTQIYVKASKHQRKLAFYKAGDIWETK